MISVTMDECQESAEIAVQHLKKHIDDLAPGVYAIGLSPDGRIVSTSRDPEDDETPSPTYLMLNKMQLPEGVKTILRTEMQELERVIYGVDIVSYRPTPEASQLKMVAFKYYYNPVFGCKRWNEWSLWTRLTSHQHRAVRPSCHLRA